MDRDVQALVAENSITTDDNKTEFLMTDYFVSLFFCFETRGGKAFLKATDSPMQGGFF